ncbi:MAG: PFL family protein, partial [Pseudoflavonifractor sp.]
MLNSNEILQTLNMIDHQHLDIRTITMGISLLDCCDPSAEAACGKIYDKICRRAQHLVVTGQAIEREFGIPIVNKRISVTPMALVAGASDTEDFVPFALAMDRAAKTCGVNFIGGFSALVQKGYTEGDRRLIAAIPEALATTDFVCSSVNVGTTRAGINMDAVAEMGRIVKATAERTKENFGFGCAKLVIFCNAVEDNPFMAGAFHGVGEGDCVINVGVSGPGVVYHALKDVKGQPFDVVAETIKKTAFRITRMGQLVAQEASRRLGVPFGIVDLSLAPTPAVGDSVARILEEMGLETCGTH